MSVLETKKFSNIYEKVKTFVCVFFYHIDFLYKKNKTLINK